MSDFDFFCAGYGSAVAGVTLIALALPRLEAGWIRVQRWLLRRRMERRLRSARYVVGTERRPR